MFCQGNILRNSLVLGGNLIFASISGRFVGVESFRGKLSDFVFFGFSLSKLCLLAFPINLEVALFTGTLEMLQFCDIRRLDVTSSPFWGRVHGRRTFRPKIARG